MTNVTLTLSLSEEPLNYHCVQVWLKSDQYCRRSSESFNLFFWFQQEKCKKIVSLLLLFQNHLVFFIAEVFLNNFSCMLSCYCETYLYLKKKKKARGLVFETKYRDHRGWHTDGDRRLLQCHLQIKRSLAIDVAETRACSHAHMIMPSVGIKLLLLNLTGTVGPS